MSDLREDDVYFSEGNASGQSPAPKPEGGGEKRKRASSSPPSRLSLFPSALAFNLRSRPLSTLLALSTVAAVLFVATQFFLAPSIDDLAERQAPTSTVIYTADGEELSRLYEENRTPVSIDSMATTLPEALVAIEDKRFFDHVGIDFKRVVGALWRTAQGSKQGGSTITMQLARNVYEDVANDWILTRKVKEWITALRINQKYSKRKVLEIYLNTMPFNYNTSGVEAASQVYFGKSAANLDVLQSATLVAMLRGPTLYNPVRNPETNKERRNQVLKEMGDLDMLTPEEVQRLQKQDTNMDFQPVDTGHNIAPHFAEYLRKRLRGWARENGYDLYRDGLRVYTAIDAGMQKAAEEAVSGMAEDLQAVANVSWSASSVPFFSADEDAYHARQNPATSFSYFWDTHAAFLKNLIEASGRYKNLRSGGVSKEEALDQLRADTGFLDSLKEKTQRVEAGLLAMRPENGYIKAWVGGRNFEEDKYDRVHMAKRQPGSTFKPFVYATALRSGYEQTDLLRDKKFSYVDGAGKEWSPGNFGKESGEMMTLKEGLAGSKNTITAQLIVDLGPSSVARTARSMGIESELQEVPSLGLGTSEVTLFEMVRAYGTLAGMGRRPKPLAVLRIEDRYGQTLASFKRKREEVLSPEVAYGTLQMMEAVVEEGTGVRIKEYVGDGGDWAAKTGTTQESADGWFMLASPALVTGAWVGFDNPQVTFRTRYWGQGSHNALKVVGRFAEAAGLEEGRFQQPAGYTSPPPRKDRAPSSPENAFASGGSADAPGQEETSEGGGYYDDIGVPDQNQESEDSGGYYDQLSSNGSEDTSENDASENDTSEEVAPEEEGSEEPESPRPEETSGEEASVAEASGAETSETETSEEEGQSEEASSQEEADALNRSQRIEVGDNQ